MFLQVHFFGRLPAETKRIREDEPLGGTSFRILFKVEFP